MKAVKKGLISVFLFIITLSWSIHITALSSPIIYKVLQGPLKLTQISGLSSDMLEEAYTYIIKYLYLPTQSNFQIPHFPSSPEGMIHFQDVKVLFFLNTIISLLGLGFFVWFMRSGRRSWLKGELRTLYKVLSIAPLFILFAFLLAFEPLFILFHQLLFTNNYWMFNPALDPIIQVLPQELFLVLFSVTIFAYEALLWLEKKFLI